MGALRGAGGRAVAAASGLAGWLCPSSAPTASTLSDAAASSPILGPSLASLVARLRPLLPWRQQRREFTGGVVAAQERVIDAGEDSVDCVVIGAGVIGLAVARALALRGREVVVVEAAGAIGTETSSRHSEVIHAGIYYPPGSLKARMCVEGKARLYDFCTSHGVPYKKITKLIVATSKEQVPELASLRARAAACGVADLQPLSGAEARDLEPALAEGVAGALLSPSTGILDSHAYMAALLADAEAHGAVLALHTRVVGGRIEPPDTSLAAAAAPTATGPKAAAAAGSGGLPYKVLELRTAAPPPDGGGGSTAAAASPAEGGGAGEAAAAAAVCVSSRLRARWVVNAAGLHAVRLAGCVAGLPAGSVPRLHLAKGNYFSLSGRCPFSRLVYPLPERGLAGLGTHLTLDLGGAGRFGPDVEWLPGADPSRLDYRVDPARAAAFYPAIRRFFPALPPGALQPAYSGVRPKLSGPGQPAADFVVQGAAAAAAAAAGSGDGGAAAAVGGHGVRGWVNLYGIESPGLTSSLALAEHVVAVLEGEAA